jgi:prepilin-type N-terminal cleavage/methylation domain-containing protein
MRRFATAGRGRSTEAGFTLIEVLVAALVLATGLGATFGMLVAASHATATNRMRQAETSLGRELVEDARSLPYTALNSVALPGALQPLVRGSTISGSNLVVSRSIYSFNVSLTACSLDDPAKGYGNYSYPPASGGSWCPDVGTSGTTNPNPDDYKRVSVLVTPIGRSFPTLKQTALVYARATHGPAVSCLSVNSTCPGTNITVTSGTSLTFNVTTTTAAASVQWLVNGNRPPSGQIPIGALDPYMPTDTTTSQFTWSFPAADGTYSISAVAFDVNGNSGTRSTLQITLNRHMVIAPASVTAGWNQQISGVDIQWVPSIDQDVLYYRVYHQYGSNSPAVVSGCSQVSDLTCTDLSAPSPLPEPATCTGTPGQSYTTPNVYWVVGVDTDPVTGQPRESTQLSPQVDANRCNHPPSAPVGLAGSVSNGQATLTWSLPSSPVDPDPSDQIEEWRIYRWAPGQSVRFPGSRLDLLGYLDASGNAVTSFTDPNADPVGTVQDYCVTAVDRALDESPCSSTWSG